MRSRAIIALLMTLPLWQACYYDTEEELYPNGFCDTANVTWSGTVQPLIQQRCAVAGCHVSNGFAPGDFTQYANVKSAVDNGTFRAEVIVAGTMPPSGRLAACDIQKLEAWIAAGAPQN